LASYPASVLGQCSKDSDAIPAVIIVIYKRQCSVTLIIVIYERQCSATLKE